MFYTTFAILLAFQIAGITHFSWGMFALITLLLFAAQTIGEMITSFLIGKGTDIQLEEMGDVKDAAVTPVLLGLIYKELRKK